MINLVLKARNPNNPTLNEVQCGVAGAVRVAAC